MIFLDEKKKNIYIFVYKSTLSKSFQKTIKCFIQTNPYSNILRSVLFKTVPGYHRQLYTFIILMRMKFNITEGMKCTKSHIPVEDYLFTMTAKPPPKYFSSKGEYFMKINHNDDINIIEGRKEEVAVLLSFFGC